MEKIKTDSLWSKRQFLNCRQPIFSKGQKNIKLILKFSGHCFSPPEIVPFIGPILCTLFVYEPKKTLYHVLNSKASITQ